MTTPTPAKKPSNAEVVGAVIGKGIGHLLLHGAIFALHLAFAWLVAIGLRHGFHVDVGYVGLAVLTFFGPKLAKLALLTL